MKITICLTVYGRPASVKEALKSIDKYVCSLWPVLVIFSESEDLTRNQLDKLISEILTDRDVVVLSTPADGIYAALNVAVKSVKTEYFTFCHSDDVIFKPLNSTTIKFDYIKDFDIITFPVLIDSLISEPRMNKAFEYDICINHMCTIFKTISHRKVLYNTNFKYSADWFAIQEMNRLKMAFVSVGYCYIKFATDGASSKLTLRRLLEDLYILLMSNWNLYNAHFKIKRITMELGGYIYGKIKRHN